MHDNDPQKPILIGMQAITQYLSKYDGTPISRTTFAKIISMGMPATVIDGMWYAHTENINLFFQKLTAASTKNNPPEDPE